MATTPPYLARDLDRDLGLGQDLDPADPASVLPIPSVQSPSDRTAGSHRDGDDEDGTMDEANQGVFLVVVGMCLIGAVVLIYALEGMR